MGVDHSNTFIIVFMLFTRRFLRLSSKNAKNEIYRTNFSLSWPDDINHGSEI